MTPSNHPHTCTRCHGCGWQDGPDEYETVAGEPHRYTTVVPCTHHWTDDNPELWEPTDA